MFDTQADSRMCTGTDQVGDMFGICWAGSRNLGTHWIYSRIGLPTLPIRPCAMSCVPGVSAQMGRPEIITTPSMSH